MGVNEFWHFSDHVKEKCQRRFGLLMTTSSPPILLARMMFFYERNPVSIWLIVIQRSKKRNFLLVQVAVGLDTSL